jgi:hypothetical protein
MKKEFLPILKVRGCHYRLEGSNLNFFKFLRVYTGIKEHDERGDSIMSIAKIVSP